MSEQANATVVEGRKSLQNILSGTDKRMLAVVGPCSIHDREAAVEYAEKLRELAERVKDTLRIVMRVYFEKPRTTIGWRGMITDPDLDGSYNIEKGLKRARELLLTINEMGLPTGSEMLDPIVPQYISDLVAWAAIGARTTESQTHREMASGLSMPVGFKNGTSGNLQLALDAMSSSVHPHSFIGIDQEGRTCVVHTKGNEYVHIILRGGRSGPNYYEENVEDAEELLKNTGLNPAVMIDCSHANSGKNHEKQSRVLRSVREQRRRGNRSIIGFMMESNLAAGNQAIPKDLKDLEYGCSVTDQCIGWEETERLIEETSDVLKGNL
jgi:3-deoxy-7-phosphoheptulonate synthase